MNKSYDLGDSVTCAAVFKTPAGVLQDPANVSFSYKTPLGVETTYVYGTDSELVKDSTGNYHANVNANAVGQWYYRFFSTGTGQAAAEGGFAVKRSQFD